MGSNLEFKQHSPVKGQKAVDKIEPEDKGQDEYSEKSKGEE
jgi:hypothetical protein